MSEIKDRLLDKMLELAGEQGWSNQTLEEAARKLGMDGKFAYVGFPQGASDAMVYYMRRLDNDMLNQYNQSDINGRKIREKTILLIETRLRLLNKHKAAVKAILQFTVIPSHAIISAESLATTCDIMWKAIGDNSTDINYYTKRFLLGSIYSSALLYWIKDESANNQDTHQFIANRIDELFSVMHAKGKLTSSVNQFIKKGLSFFKKH